VWQDTVGNIYVGENNGDVLRKISAATGIIEPYAGKEFYENICLEFKTLFYGCIYFTFSIFELVDLFCIAMSACVFGYTCV
jgi:hypothetical protein